MTAGGEVSAEVGLPSEAALAEAVVVHAGGGCAATTEAGSTAATGHEPTPKAGQSDAGSLPAPRGRFQRDRRSRDRTG